ncbi:DUF1836 domain-containing protein [Anaeromicropila populeti]|uniref:DUF1836 domain-containing protein n=1 Tax=Anaeromicropila populeti TaxID=37658 RepID=A0A1I6KSG5_9FIRM|nr:DUF1836 domain-containing protein [Anaeromicropila populeti]SFR94172.1 protein of unknown function [Anaeromicropila populeti]
MATTNEEYIRAILKNLRGMDYIKPDEIPNIELYMDQVTTFMDKHLKSSKRYEDDKMLTKTMINNYTKNNLLPSPNKKKYSKEHMLLLIFIYYFKSFLSISDIQNIFDPLTEKFYEGNKKFNLEDIYKEVYKLEKEQVDSLSKDVIRKYEKAERVMTDKEKNEESEFLVTFYFICMLSFDVYVKKMIIEKMIDEKLVPMASKKEKEKEKPKEKEKEKPKEKKV